MSSSDEEAPRDLHVKDVLDILTAHGGIAINCSAEAVPILKRLLTVHKYEQEKHLKKAGLLALSDQQRLRFKYDADKERLTIKLSNPILFTIAPAADSSDGK